MSGQDITINGPDGDFGGYLSTPAGGSGPGVVVIQEIFGVNKVMRDIADDLAGQGYVALCPDLFWRLEPGIQLTDQSQEEWQKAFDLFGKFKSDTGVTDIQATISHLRNRNDCSGKVGAVGYCLGGLLAYLTAARTDIDASVGFYGVALKDFLGEATSINNPLMLHVAAKDEFVPPDAQKAVADGLADNGNVTIHTYAENDHAFARVGGEHYDEVAAKKANSRTTDFFKTHLS